MRPGQPPGPPPGPCPATAYGAHLTVPSDKVGYVHLSSAVDSVEYQIQYALAGSTNVPEDRWADFYRDGKPLTLKPDNTPLRLDTPGVYRLIAVSLSKGIISTETFSK